MLTQLEAPMSHLKLFILIPQIPVWLFAFKAFLKGTGHPLFLTGLGDNTMIHQTARVQKEKRL